MGIEEHSAANCTLHSQSLHSVSTKTNKNNKLASWSIAVNPATAIIVIFRAVGIADIRAITGIKIAGTNVAWEFAEGIIQIVVVAGRSALVGTVTVIPLKTINKGM
jgi:hypothetical protein